MKSATWKKSAAEVEVVGHHAEPGRCRSSRRAAGARRRPRSAGPSPRPARRRTEAAGRRSGAAASASAGAALGAAASPPLPELELDALELDLRSGRRCGSARPAARRFRRRRDRLAEHDELAVVGGELALGGCRPRPPALGFGERDLQLVDLAESSSASSRLGPRAASRRRPRGRRRPGSRRSGGWRSSIQPSASDSAMAARLPGRRVTGTGAASKATTIWNWAMKSRRLAGAMAAAEPPSPPSSRRAPRTARRRG